MKNSLGGGGLRTRAGFTLVELLVATVVLLLIMGILLTVTTQAGNLWRTTTAKMEQFRGARDAFESMTRHLSQATLNTYWDYDSVTAPTKYVRQSELRFICGKTVDLAGTPDPATGRQWPGQGVFFQAPLGFSQDAATTGLENLLNTWGYFTEFGSDAAQRPGIVTQLISPLRYRYRLCELMQPTNALSIYNYTSGLDGGGVPKNLSYTGKDWFSKPLNLPDNSTAPVRPVHVLAENIVALVLLPKLSQKDEVAAGVPLSSDYSYDSTLTKPNPAINPKNQLPPLVEVTMVAISEAAAVRLAQTQGTTMPTFGMTATAFTDPTLMATDLGNLQKNLGDAHIAFRVFSTIVAIKGAKWSREEAN